MNLFNRTFLPAAAGLSLAVAAVAQNAASTAPAAGNANVVGISSQDGITMSDTGVLITRNGITQQMKTETALTSGANVMPDGTIVGKDGTKVMLRPGQLLTFDGKLMSAAASSSSSTGGAPAGGAAPTTP